MQPSRKRKDRSETVQSQRYVDRDLLRIHRGVVYWVDAGMVACESPALAALNPMKLRNRIVCWSLWLADNWLVAALGIVSGFAFGWTLASLFEP